MSGTQFLYLTCKQLCLNYKLRKQRVTRYLHKKSKKKFMLEGTGGIIKSNKQKYIKSYIED